MKLAFFSNFLNHHQLPLCMNFYNNPKIEFVFVACEKIPDNRLSMGYEDMNTKYPFVVRAYEDEQKVFEIIQSYDVIIFGGTPLKFIEERMKTNKLTFRFCERSLKKGTWRRFIPRTRKKIYNEYIRYKNSNLYILGASSYTASDLALCGFPKDKCFQWGYFPETEEKNIDDLFRLKAENTVPEILYAGRLLKLKHVMDTVKAVHKLILQNVDCHFTIIGDGECAEEIKQYISKNELEKHIKMLPFMSPAEVRGYMDKADIYVLGSNFYEGWGAVVNEAMNSACAMVVSHAVGSAAYLINDNENGFIYKFADIDQLTKKLKLLVENKNLREKFGRQAYYTITHDWSAEVAAQRFINLAEKIAENEDCRYLYSDGPCSLSK